jgi:signal transduction histidine kinase
MKRPWHIWIGFALCLAVVLAAMGWLSLTALRLDRAAAEARRQEAEAHRQTAWEENIRLALWRMDWTVAPLVAQESARPYFVYSSFLPVNRAFSNMFNERGEGERLIPSPLLSEVSPNILVHFQFEPDGRLTSPQVPLGANRELAVPDHASQEAVGKTEARLARVAALVDRDRLLGMLPARTPEPVAMVVSPLAQTAEQRLAQRQSRQFDLQNRGRGAVEFSERSQAFRTNTSLMVQSQAGNTLNDLLFPPTDVGGVLMTPLWIDGELILARRVSAGGREYVQGCLLDWPAIKTSLLETVDDLLPKADLEPVLAVRPEREARMLAALPVRLLPGEMSLDWMLPGQTSVEAEGLLSPILLSLVAAWVCVLLAAVAVAALLLGVVRLSERRAAFVTAVTHELRTPLTTFQMYAEMLAEGMVPDAAQQKHYLSTLRAESVRLAHLVENVLCYARLERGRTQRVPYGRLEQLSLGQLVAQIQGRLAGRAEQAGMQLVLETKDGAAETTVRANVSAAEQILFNLVDNACKYAAPADDRRIHLTLEADNGAAQLQLRDHGPGVSAAVRRRLFQPFSKSAREAAHTAPGVGLGLALSRRLARDMGGDLRLDDTISDGACFVLTLPATCS